MARRAQRLVCWAVCALDLLRRSDDPVRVHDASSKTRQSPRNEGYVQVSSTLSPKLVAGDCATDPFEIAREVLPSFFAILLM